nr:linear gramicidin synthase subunit D-like [Nerophis lumbriciformis]
MSTVAIGRLSSDEKRSLLKRLLEERGSKPRRHPLSFAQQRLWFLSQLDPESSDYTILYAIRLIEPGGTLDPHIMERALAELALRHEILRTTFEPTESSTDSPGGAWQVVRPQVSFEVSVLCLHGLPDKELDEAVDRAAREFASRPFDLRQGPLLRLMLIDRDADVWVILLAVHHIIGDNQSLQVISDQLTGIYRALANGTPLLETRPGPSYGDFARWQRKRFGGEQEQRQVTYWTERLEALPNLELPTDYARPTRPSVAGGRVGLELDEEVSARLDHLRRRMGVTTFMLTLTGFYVLLHRYSGQNDLIVGTPISGRHRPEVRDSIGLFLNLLVLRLSTAGDPTFLQLLDQVKEVAVGAFEHQDVPFEQLVEELHPRRDPSRHPLFQVMFLFLQELEMPEDLGMEPQQLSGQTSKFDLTHLVIEEPERLFLIFEYKTDLFERGTIERMAGHMRRLLEQIAEDPDLPLSRFKLLGKEEEERILQAWNDTAAEWPRAAATVPELFRAAVRRCADQEALVYRGEGEEECLSYSALADRVHSCALALVAEGVGTDRTVGVFMRRSVELVVALLAVLKAGGHYLPLDPDLPDERIHYMVKDARPRLILYQEGLEDRALSLSRPARGLAVMTLTPRAVTPERTGASPMPAIMPESLAYTIYTSGSTGRPKGVMNSHAALRNRLLWMQETYAVGSGDRVLQKTPFGFDVSVWEFFLPLISGATLVIVRPGGHRDPAYLGRSIAADSITLIHFVPSMLQAFLEAPGLEKLDGLRQVIASGEALPAALVRRFYQRLPPTVGLDNLYGPTEAAIDVSRFACPSVDLPTQIPLGAPVSNTVLHVLDRKLRPVALGIAGELHIGGVQLARGYGHRPGLSAARFVPDPWASRGGSRLYKTRDRARRRADGSLEFLGRLDHQVKVRGHRIELGEIEATLMVLEGVREATVLLRKDLPGGEEGLVAYLTFEDGADLDLDRIRDRLTESLPGYMVPVAFVALERLPLTSNGKVDREALRPPADSGLERAQYEAPRTPTEELLANIWADLLDLERPGRRDDFFRLGGHSLLAGRVAARLTDALGVEPPLRLFFDHSVLTETASALDSFHRMAADLPMPPPLEALEKPAAGVVWERPVSFGQERLWFLDRLEPGLTAYNMPMALCLEGTLDPLALEKALNAVVDRHEILRTRFVERAGVCVQQILPAMPLDLNFEDLRGEEDAEAVAEARMTDEAVGLFDLARGPLIRASLFQLGEGFWRLAVTLHHIVADGWSLALLLRDVRELYREETTSEPANLPRLLVQYGDYAAWQRDWLVGDALDRQLAYWRGRQAEAPSLLELPTDRPRPARQSFRGDAVPIRLGPGLSQQVAQFCRGPPVGALGRPADLVVGSPVAGRPRVELEGLVGFFVNVLPLRVDLSGNPSFGSLLEQVRGSVLEAFSHQQVPFEKLVDDLEVPRRLGHAPVFQAMFVLQQYVVGDSLDLPELEIQPESRLQQSTKLDLTLSLEEGPDGTLGGSLEYATDLFDRSTAERMARCYLHLLDGLLSRPEAGVFDLALADTAELQSVLDFGRRQESAGEVHSLWELVEGHARSHPDSVALIFEGQRFSYAELVASSRRLAARLRRRGVRAETVVGLALDRRPERVVGMLAVHAAGGAFLPLDPSYPPERLLYMAEDSSVRWVLTRRELRASLPVFEGAELLDVELFDGGPLEGDRGKSGAAELMPEELDLLGRGARPDLASLAYVIYTSGSTGRPKGTLLSHEGLSNLLSAMEGVFRLGREARVLQLASLGFDASVFEIGAALGVGASLVLARSADLLPGPGLLELLERQRVSFLVISPSVLAELPSGELPELAQVLSAGEPLPPSLVDRWASGRVLWNGYGPTESTVWSSVAQVLPGEVVTVGGPVANVELRVVDEGLVPVPIGVPGELLVGGVSLARGYLSRPGLTAERFVPDGSSKVPGSRMYRSGDLVRWLAGGHLDFLGRRDQQVKLRGFRIELGEVEARLEELEGVEQAVAVVFEDAALKDEVLDGVASEDAATKNAGASPVNRALCAYVRGVPSLVGAELRRRLRSVLPEHMLPARVMVLESFPKSVSGKVDRGSLPRPELQTHAEYVAPRNPREEILGAVWEDLLGVERVGVLDNYFDLGGHSLLAARLASRIRDLFGVEMPLRVLFEGPTLAEVAAWLEHASGVSLPSIEGLAEPADAAGVRRHPLSFAQQRLWFLEQMAPGTRTYHLPLAIRLSGQLDRRALVFALDTVAGRHESLRTTFETRDGTPSAVVRARDSGWPDFQALDFSALEPECQRAEEHRLLANERLFDLEGGSLARGRLLIFGPEESVLALVLHHAITDGWSMSLLIDELAVAYSSAIAGVVPELPSLGVQYGDYAVWQRELFEEGALEDPLDYWRQTLDSAPKLLELPTDRPRPTLQGFRGDAVPFHWSATLDEDLQTFCRQQGVTPFMVLLAAFQVLLGRWARSRDVIVGSPIAGRSRTEVEGLVGFFINTLVLRTDLSGDQSFRDLLHRVRETALGAFAHQDVPFERLVEELEPSRDLGHPPLVQVVFSYLADPLPSPELPGLQASLVEPEGSTAKFDLTLTVERRAEGLFNALAYSTDLFDRATVEELARQLGRLVKVAITRPETRIDDLFQLEGTELRALLQLGRGWPQPVEGPSLIERVSRLAEERGDAVALTEPGGASLSYGEWVIRSRRVARLLAQQGIGIEDRVGILLPRGLDLAVAYLAALEAGAAYLPLDPALPVDRLRIMVADSGASLVICDQGLKSRLPKDFPVLSIDDLGSDLESLPATPMARPLPPERLAYLIYTSGSTGAPKGVGVEYRALDDLVAWFCRAYEVGPEDRFSCLAGLGFDALVFELWPPLAMGARVDFLADEVRLDPRALWENFQRLGTTVAFLPTPVLEVVLGSYRAPGAGPRILVTGGDRLVRRPEGQETFKVFNNYGPTEATVVATWGEVEPRTETSRPPTIGRSVDRGLTMVLDSQLWPVQEGVPGELYLGGGGLARGYFGQPALSAQSYLPCLWADEAGARMYRTGDLARWLLTGELEFLGRSDRQVQVRGARVELGEIEAVLAGCPHLGGGASVAVVAPVLDSGEVCLVACLGGVEGKVKSALVEYLHQRLPAYMVPTVWEFYDLLPLNRSGKVDRQLLAQTVSLDSSNTRAPQGAWERAVVEAFSEVLGLAEASVSAETDFFSAAAIRFWPPEW